MQKIRTAAQSRIGTKSLISILVGDLIRRNTARKGYNVFEKIERYAKTVQNLTIVAGIFIAIATVFTNQLDKRVARTLDISKEYNTNIRRDLLKLWSQWNEIADREGV